MNYFLFILKEALIDFSRNKGRTFLTSLGILIGVLAVVLLVAFGLGLRKYIQDQFESLGTNLLRVVPGKIFQGGNIRTSNSSFGGIRFDERDVLRLQRIPNASAVVPVYIKTTTVSTAKDSSLSDMYTASADIFTALNLTAEHGELFTKSDVDKRSKVIVIGPKVAEKLYTSIPEAVGKSLKIEGQSFRIKGVLESKGGGGFGGPDLDSFIYMPYKTGYIFNVDKKFAAVMVKASNDETLQQVKNDISETLLRRYEEDDFSVVEQTEILNAVSSIFGVLNAVLVAIAAISLVVGGIGIMNIMYVTVTERIKEIGIRRALGARKLDILMQFLVESIILSLLGGLMGIFLAWVIVFFIQQLFPAYINIESVALALGVSTAIGVIFGVFPAKKAADLSPMEAIRYE